MCHWVMAAGLPRDIWVLPPLPPLQLPARSLHKLLWAYLDSKEEALQAAEAPPGHALPAVAQSHCSTSFCRHGESTQTWLWRGSCGKLCFIT